MRILKFLIIQIILVIVFALVLEGIGRSYYLLKHGYSFKESLLYVGDEKLVFKLNPNYKGKYVIHNGFRGDPFSKVKPEGYFRIVALGGSTTWGGTSYQNTRPFQLALVLNKNNVHKEMKYEVINAGISGYGSAQLYIRLKDEILGLEPDMIIILSGWNLVGSVDNDVAYWVPDNVAKPNSKPLERIAAFLTNNSVIFAKLRAKFPGYLDIFDLGIEEQKKLELRFRKLTQRHKLYLKKMVRLARGHNIIPVIIKFPQIYNATLKKEDEPAILKDRFPELFEHRAYLNRQYEWMIASIEEAADEEGAFLIDCSDCFDGFGPEGKIEFFLDQMHLKDEGFPIEALTIYNALIKNEGFQSKKTEILKALKSKI